VLICVGGIAVETWTGSTGATARSPRIEGSRVFSFGVGPLDALTDAGCADLMVSTKGDADGEAALEAAGPHRSVSVSPSLLVALMVLDTGGAPKSVKPLVVLSRSLPLSFAVYGSNARSLPRRLRPLSASGIGAEDEKDKPRDPVRSRSNPRVVSMLGMLGVPMTDSTLGNSTAEPNLLVGTPEVKEAGECPREVMRDGALVTSSSGTLSDSSSSPRDPLSL
jgi:hypothetical protein